MIRQATAADAAHLVRFINMAADDLPLHFWRKSVGPDGDALAYGRALQQGARALAGLEGEGGVFDVDGAHGGSLGRKAAVTDNTPVGACIGPFAAQGRTLHGAESGWRRNCAIMPPAVFRLN